MALADLRSTSNFTQRFADADYVDPDESIPTIENRRRARANSAAMAALMSRADPSMNRQRSQVERIEDQQAKDYELEYTMPRRARLAGNLEREEAMREAEAAQGRYFAQEPMRQSEQRRAESMEALKQRTSMIKADADVQREVLRGGAARDVAGISGGSRERAAATNQYGDVTGAQALTGDRAAAAAGSGELRSRMGAPQKTITMSGPRGLQAFAQERGMSIDEAMDYAESQGYTVTR